VRRLVGALLVCLLLASCTPGSSTSATGSSSSGDSRVDVDTPALRALKAGAGVEPCPAGGRSVNQLPAVRLRCLGGGRTVDLTSLRGPLVINLFAQWCGPCRSELPYYQALHEKAKGVVTVVGIDYLDVQPEAALQLVKDTGVTFPLMADPGGALRAPFRVRGLPGVVFVGKDGSVSQPEFRVVKSYAELRGLVQDELDVRIPS